MAGTAAPKVIDVLRAHQNTVIRATATLDTLPEDKETEGVHKAARKRNLAIIDRLEREIEEEDG
jgi:hypothetical protein